MTNDFNNYLNNLSVNEGTKIGTTFNAELINLDNTSCSTYKKHVNSNLEYNKVQNSPTKDMSSLAFNQFHSKTLVDYHTKERSSLVFKQLISTPLVDDSSIEGDLSMTFNQLFSSSIIDKEDNNTSSIEDIEIFRTDTDDIVTDTNLSLIENNNLENSVNPTNSSEVLLTNIINSRSSSEENSYDECSSISENSTSDSSLNDKEFDNITTDNIDDRFKFFSDKLYTVMYSNIDQNLTGKLHEIKLLIDKFKPSIVCLTEIEPKVKTKSSSVKESEIQIKNYTLFMNSNRLRGIAIYIDEKLNPRECYKLNNGSDFNEFLFCEFNGGNNEKVLVGGFYRSPNSCYDNTKKLYSVINSDLTSNYDILCLMGDFNYSNIKWDDKFTNYKDNEFIEALRDALLIQKVKFPTRNIRINQQSNILDLILTNDDDAISEIIHAPPIGFSDHDTLFFQLNIIKEKTKEEKILRFNLSKGKYDDMRSHLDSINWNYLENVGVEECWNDIKDRIVDSMEKFIPKIKTGKTKHIRPCWMNNKLLRKIKKKYHSYKRFLISKSGRDYENYIKKRNDCARKIRKAKRKHEKNIAKNCKENPKDFWKYVNEKSKTCAGLSCLKDKNGKLLINDKDKADALNSFFTSVFLKEDLSDLPQISEGSLSSGRIKSDCKFTEIDIEKKLKDLNSNKAQGPDSIPPKVLKELAKQLSKPLCILFNKSFETGQIPNDWKFAVVTALHKKGNKTDPSNYRPVSLTCICCKLMEKFIRDSIVDHLIENDLYSNCQHGFRSGRSCVTQLIEVIDDLTKLLDEGNKIDMIYLDFKKAFDSIPHERLLIKMKGYGITGKLLDWVRAFLAGRKQQVRVGTEFSEVTNVLSGIPQGSILGPVLFTIFINDLPDSIKSNCKIFADDTKVYNIVENKDTLQADLYKMQDWTDKWKLYFNVSKCKIMHLGKKNTCNDYFMKIDTNIQKLESCVEEKDLGIIFDPTLNFDIHINNIIKKANQMIGIIKRTFSYLDKEIFCKLYKSLVRSHLEYGNVIWAPHLKRQSISLEKVQRRATKLVPQCKGLNYRERLDFLNLYSLKGRRERGDLIQVFKIFNKIDNIDLNILPLSHYQQTRNQQFKLRTRYSKTDMRKFSFTNRVVQKWNELPLEIKLAKDVNSFKNMLDNNEQIRFKFFEYDGIE